jgi:hypothetical protein
VRYELAGGFVHDLLHELGSGHLDEVDHPEHASHRHGHHDHHG